MLAYFFLAGDPNLYDLWKVRQKGKFLQMEISENRRLQHSLVSEITLLKSDPNYVEKIAREEYKMGYPGERIYSFKSRTHR